MKVKHLLIDANNIFYRAHFAVKLEDKYGRPTSGIHGTMNMVQAMIRDNNPKNVIIAWDKGKSTERLALYPEYKSGRVGKYTVEDKENMERQMKILRKMFKLLPVKQVFVKNVEADDLIGMLCRKLTGKKLIISNDTDFFQLISKDVKIYNSTIDKVLSVKNIEDHLDYPVKHYILWKSMVGDTSDSIKGIKGIGPVKARNIIINGLTSKKKLPITKEEMEILDRNKYLISIGALVTDEQEAKLIKKYNKEKHKEINFEEVRSTLRSLGLKELHRTFYSWSSYFGRLKDGKKSEKETRKKKSNKKNKKILKGNKKKVKKIRR